MLDGDLCGRLARLPASSELSETRFHLVWPFLSLSFVQNIVNTVGDDIKRLLEIFKKRNPMFNGKYSVCGHSLGKD